MQTGQVSIGHPVDVALGTVYSTYEDIYIPGKVALVWERRYSTALPEGVSTALGPGWTTCYFATLTQNKGEFRLFSPEGDIELFADPEGTVDRGGVVRNLGTFQELCKRDNQYIFTRWDTETGKVERFFFKEGPKGEEWLLACIEDVTGQGVDMLRDDTGRLTGIRQRLEERTLLIEYSSSNLIKSVSLLLPGNQQQVLVSYEYDKSGQLNAAYDALGYVDHYEYDTKSRLSREILKDNGVFSFKYDDKGRCIRVSGLDGYDEKTFRYLDHIGLTEVTNSLGQVKRFQWLPSSQVVSEITPLGAVKRTEYDEYGRIIAQIDPNGATTKYEYDAQGNRSKTIDALGHETLYTFNDHHLPLTLTDPAGNVWRRYYDESNQIVATENPLGGRWTYRRDSNGNIIEVTNPNGAHLRRLFSKNGVLVEETDWEGHTTRYKVDNFGRLIERRSALGEVTRVQYDPLGNPVAVEFPDSTRITCTYDSSGNLTRKTDANGNIYKFLYGPCRRLLEREDPLGRVVRYQWGSEPKHLEMIINEKGEFYTFNYNEAGQIRYEKGFDGREVEFIYDLAGNCIATINGLGEKTTYVIDELGRLNKKIFSDSTVESFEYDICGNMISAINSSYEIRFERDSVGRVLKEYQGDYIIEREYDLIGYVTKVKTTLDFDVSYKYDQNGHMSSLMTNNGYEITFSRNELGKETIRKLPGNIELKQQYDSMSQLTEQNLIFLNNYIPKPRYLDRNSESVSSSGSSIIKRNYEYDNSGNLTFINDNRWGYTRYFYDEAEHLIQSIRENGTSEKFGYDESGNITNITLEGIKDEILDYDEGNHLLCQGRTRFFYDDNGRLIKKVENFENKDMKEWNLIWDNQDQLKSIIKPDGTVWKYKYDAFGRRISKEGPNENFCYVWDQDVIIHQLVNDKLDSTWIFDRYNFEPLCTLQDNSGYAIVCDHLRTPKEILDIQGKIVWTANHKAWGQLDKTQSSQIDCPIRAPGQWFDEESGLYYNRFRYYDPENGRFISPDPIGLRGGLNQYLYARNPINRIDPFGLTECDDDELAERARKDAARDMREADRELSDHDKEFYGGEGVIYRVPGSGTPTGKPYVGSADDLEVRTKTATDGRDRSQAQQIGSYPIGDRAARRRAEQQAMDDEGGIANLDNKRREIAE